MKNVSVVLAYQALERLKEQPMDLRSSYALLKLMQKLKQGYLLYCEAEKKLIEDLGLIDKLSGDHIVFGEGPEAVEKAQHFSSERKILDEMDSEVDFGEKIRITAKNIKINMKDLMALEDFVEFVGLEEGGSCDEGCAC